MTDDLSFGQRLRIHRQHAGKTRAVLGGLVGRSEAWVKALETGRLLTPRLPMLIRLADALGLDDLGALTGSQSLPVVAVTKAGHPHTAAVAAALFRTEVNPGDPLPASSLVDRTDRAWTLWHRSSTERTAVGAVLPDLIGAARTSARRLDGGQRRAALVCLARTYHLTQLFLAHQPQAELVWIAADRAMQAAQDADDPQAVAVAAWYYGHLYRASAQFDAAQDTLAEAAEALDPDAGVEDRARWGQLHLGMALVSAKTGDAGLAWRHWDTAHRAATELGPSYNHPWLMFGTTAVEAYAVAVETDLMRPGEAVRRASRVEYGRLPSRTRRAAHLIDAARAHLLRREEMATVALLGLARRESADAVRHQPYARSAVVELAARPGTVGAEARELALTMGMPG